jgi:hypothetical protein
VDVIIGHSALPSILRVVVFGVAKWWDPVTRLEQSPQIDL